MFSSKIIVSIALSLVCWLGVIFWQVSEHSRISRVARATTLSYAKDMAHSVAVIINSQRMSQVLIKKYRLQESIKALAESTSIISVALKNIGGRVIAQAGEPYPDDIVDMPVGTALWMGDQLSIVEYVQINSEYISNTDNMALMVSLGRPIVKKKATSAKPKSIKDRAERMDLMFNESAAKVKAKKPVQTRTEEQKKPDATVTAKRAVREAELQVIKDVFAWLKQRYKGNQDISLSDTLLKKHADIYKSHGIHKFVMTVPVKKMKNELAKDYTLRIIIITIAFLAIGALNIAYFSFRRNVALRLRLIRTQELNVHLREMSTMSAGLAHEIRNPLNIVRGVSQMMADDDDIGCETRVDMKMISEEVDRVTSKLNELISYSKPIAPRRSVVQLNDVIESIERTLETDREEKSIQIQTVGTGLCAYADATLLRQVIFNILLNAFQAVGYGGKVTVITGLDEREKIFLEISDDGPGVPEEAQNDIFSPYYTLNENGTGLGLAIVRQIVLAHQWKIEYVDNPNGATFRISNITQALENTTVCL